MFFLLKEEVASVVMQKRSGEYVYKGSERNVRKPINVCTQANSVIRAIMHAKKFLPM